MVMSIGSTNHSTTTLLAREIMATLPRKLGNAIDKWITSTKVVFPGNASWVSNLCCGLFDLSKDFMKLSIEANCNNLLVASLNTQK